MKKKKPIKIITLDTETYNGLIGGLKKIAIYDGLKVYYGDTFKEIEPILNNYHIRGYEVHVYIHNAEFDLRKFWDDFKSDIIWEKSLIINGKVAKITCENYIFHDSFKILPMSLAKLSKGFNVEHGKLDLWEQVQERYPKQYTDIVDYLDRCPIDDELFLEYLGYDVISLYEVLMGLKELTGLTLYDFVGRISTASLSRFIFKNGYKGNPFVTGDSNQTDYEKLCSYKWQYDLQTEEFIRLSYCGGRTEVFTPRLDKQGFHYDVNSLYPFVCHEKEYPIGKPDYTEKGSVAENWYNAWLENHTGLGFLNCKVYIPKQPIPPLPVKMGKLVFPCGEVVGCWTYTELEYAIKECGVEIREYYCAAQFKRTFPIFRNFVETFYKLKQEASESGNEALRTLAKLLLNVAYGYTGMNREKTQLKPFDKWEDYSPEEIHYMDEQLGFIEVDAKVKSEYIQVQVASYVTSYARIELLKGLREVIKEGGHCYYCDTDSIVSDIKLPDYMVHDSDLGKFKLEGLPIKGLFLKPKVYTELFENEPTNIKFKGVSKDTQKTLTYEYYEELYKELEEQKKEYVVVEKNKTLLRSILYMQKKELPSDYHEIRNKKMNLNTVEKRTMYYKENRTEPLYFETVEEFENFTFKAQKKIIVFDVERGGVDETI